MEKLVSVPGHRRQLMISVMLALTTGCAIAAVQSGPPTVARSGTQILLLGTNAGPPLHKERSEPSSLLIVDGQPYLIDCGIGAMRQMVLAGIQSETIGTIFITHHHLDHVLDLADVMANDFLMMNLNDARRTINIYGPPQTKELVEAGFKYISIPITVHGAEGVPGVPDLRSANAKLVSPFAAHDIQRDGVVYQDEQVRVIAAENSHFATLSAQFRAHLKSYSYRFETRHGVVVFTGDTGPSDAVAQLAKGADVLVSEAGLRNAMLRLWQGRAEKNHWPPERLEPMTAHFKHEHLDAEDVGELASKAQVKSVLLYHLNTTDDPAEVVSGVKKHFSGPVFASADLDRYCLTSQAGERPSAPILSLCQ